MSQGYVVPEAWVRVLLDGRDLAAGAQRRVQSLRLLDKRAGEADEFELTLDDADGQLAIPARGAAIRVELGWRRGAGVTVGLVDKGGFVVDEASHEGPPDRICIRARSADFTGALAKRRDASYRATTLGDVVRQVAARHGLKPQVAPSVAAIEVPVLGQTARSDIAMVRQLGRRHDAVATVKDGRLILAPIGVGTTAGGRALPATTIARADCSSHRYQLASRDDVDGVEASWHDRGAAEKKTVVAGGGTRRKRLRKVYASEADARHAAAAEQKRAKRAAATLELDLPLGRADLYPDRPLSVTGFKSEIGARRWVIAEVEHSLDGRGGYTSRIKAETAA